MAFWFDRGVSGFRVDMAFSLVKDDHGLIQTTLLWREIREWMEQAYPDAVIVPEGVEPRIGEPLAFHADFFLVIFPEHGSLFDNQGAGVSPFHEPWRPFFEAAGEGSTDVFLAAWERVHEVDPDRPVILASADHDLSRLACGTRTQEQLRPAFAFLLTWGSVPSVYYGDEIGMRYLPGLPDVEGAICNPAYNRAGCRTPMQWDGGVNAGFSSAEADALYLPIDPDPERPNVADQLARHGLDPSPRQDAHRPAEGSSRPRRPGLERGAPRGLSARLRARRHAPRGRQSATGRGLGRHRSHGRCAAAAGRGRGGGRVDA